MYSDGADKNRGAKYSYYLVTKQQDFPSILVEMGFVSNEEDALALADPNHQKNIAARIVKGIQNYIGRSNISIISGGASRTETPEQTTPETAEEPPALTTAAAETDDPAAATAEYAAESGIAREEVSLYDLSEKDFNIAAVTPGPFEPDIG